MIFRYEILNMRLDMIRHYAALADPSGLACADYWRIRETISL